MRACHLWLPAILLLFAGNLARGAKDTPLLLQQPTLSKTSLVFEYGGYLWTVSRDGGEAR